MKTVEDQLRELAHHADRSMPWIDPLDLMLADRATDLAHPADDFRKRDSRTWLVATFAAAAVVCLALLIPLLLRSDDSIGPAGDRTPADIADVPPSTSVDLAEDQVPVVPTTVVSSAPVVPTTVVSSIEPVSGVPLVADLSWRQVDGWQGRSPQWITAYPGGGYVASGIAIEPRYSLDGESWTADPFHAEFEGLEDVFVEGRYAVADSTDRRGDLEELTEFPTPLPGRLWVHARWDRLLEFDGEEWSEINLEGLITAPPVTSGSLVLVQGETEGRERQFEKYWLSVDGSPFVRFSGPPSGDPLLNSPQVFAVPSGGFGVYWETGELWLSTDGINWAETADFFELTGERIGGPRVLAWSSYGGGLVAQRWNRPFAWYSEDGVSFEKRVQPSGSLADGVRYLAQYGEEGVLVNLSRIPQLWRSLDMRVWAPLTPPEPRPAQSGPERGRIALTPEAVFYWYDTADGEVVMQIAGTR